MVSFADRLAWLLAVVPRHPDRPAEHFEMNELETALTATDERAGRSLEGTRGNSGRDWLHAAREGAVDLADDRHRPYLNALEDTLRLPRGYFLDDALATTTDELIALAAELRAGLRRSDQNSGGRAEGLAVVGSGRYVNPTGHGDHALLGRV
jgi:hypothetical protein